MDRRIFGLLFFGIFGLVVLSSFVSAGSCFGGKKMDYYYDDYSGREMDYFYDSYPCGYCDGYYDDYYNRYSDSGYYSSNTYNYYGVSHQVNTQYSKNSYGGYEGRDSISYTRTERVYPNYGYGGYSYYYGSWDNPQRNYYYYRY